MANLTDIDLKKILPAPTFWSSDKLADKIRRLIKTDALKGILQGDLASDNYRSEQYKKYKANFMNRFTDGKKLKAYSGQSVRNNDVSKVNMHLTGQLFAKLGKFSFTAYSIIMTFGEENTGKLAGALRYARDIMNLNNKNANIIADDLAKHYEREIGTKIKGMTIRIGK